MNGSNGYAPVSYGAPPQGYAQATRHTATRRATRRKATRRATRSRIRSTA